MSRHKSQNRTAPRVETYDLKASNGNHIRMATKVTFHDGQEVKFVDLIPIKSEAIREAEFQRAAKARAEQPASDEHGVEAYEDSGGGISYRRAAAQPAKAEHKGEIREMRDKYTEKLEQAKAEGRDLTGRAGDRFVIENTDQDWSRYVELPTAALINTHVKTGNVNELHKLFGKLEADSDTAKAELERVRQERDELLALVKDWLSYWEQTDEPESALAEDSRAAIAKAEGRK